MMTTLDSMDESTAASQEQDPGRLAAMRAGYLKAYEMGQRVVQANALMT